MYASQRRCQARKYGRRKTHESPAQSRSVNGCGPLEDRSSTCLHQRPDEHADERDGDHDRLGKEEPADLAGVDEEEGELDDPEDEVAEHAAAGNSCRLREVVGKVSESRRPRDQHLLNALRAGVALDGEPEEGEDDSRDDGEPGEVVTEGGPGLDGKGDSEDRASCPLQRDGHGNDEVSEEDWW